MEIPSSIFEEMAKGFTFVLEGRLYKATANGQSDDCFSIGENCFQLTDLETISKLEELEEEFRDEELSDFFVSEFSQETKLLTTASIEKEMQELQLMEFIYEKVLPHYINKNVLEARLKHESLPVRLKPEDAQKYSRTVSDQAFVTKSGIQVHSIEQLVDCLREMHPRTFREQVKSGNDFYYWIGDTIGDRLLADRVNPVREKNELIQILRSRLNEYQEVLAQQEHQEVHAQDEVRATKSSRLSAVARQHGKVIAPAETGAPVTQRELHDVKTLDEPAYDFRIKDKAKVVRHLGFLNGYDEHHSYSGLDKKEIPLFTTGEITAVEGELVTVEVHRGESWQGDVGDVLAAVRKRLPVRVRVKRAVTKPHYDWGNVTHNSVGLATSYNPDTNILWVDFPEFRGWKALPDDMEAVDDTAKQVQLHVKEIRKDYSDKRLERKLSLLEKAVKQVQIKNDIALSDKFVYELVERGRQNSQLAPDAVLKFHGKEYGLRLNATVTQLFAAYDQLRKDYYKGRFIERQPKLIELRKKKSSIEAQFARFESGDYKIFARRIDPSKYELVLRMKPFMLVNKHGDTFCWDAMTLKMPVTINKGNIVYDTIRLEGTHSHPFIGLNKKDSDICFGDYDFASYNKLPREKQIVQHLNTAEHIIVASYDPYGHEGGGYRPRLVLTREYFEGYYRSPQKARKLEQDGILITNKPAKVKEDADA